MTRQEKAERDAITRLRAALLDLVTAQRFTEANDVAAIIERIEPPLRGEAASAARADGSAAGSGSASLSPVTSTPATFQPGPKHGRYDVVCGNCDRTIAAHCTTHLLPCCPGSLMHGQDEGTWTPTSLDPA